MLRHLRHCGYTQLLVGERPQLDLRNQVATLKFFQAVEPEIVILAAAKVGGIVANSSSPYDFIYDNIMIAANVIESCRLTQVKKTLILGSTCIYPRLAAQPIREDSLLTGPLEPTNQWYAIAKIAAIKMAQAARLQHDMNVISVMPTNLYGPNDNFEIETSHVLPALIRKFHDAKVAALDTVTLWGTGTPFREFLHVDDLARALLLLLQEYDDGEIINVGSGKDVSISDLAHIVAGIVGFGGQIVFDASKPDGTPRKRTDNSRILNLGWTPQVGLKDGIKRSYDWYLENEARSRVGASST